MTPRTKPSKAAAPQRPIQLTDRVYSQLKEEICNFHFLPGDRFSENELAERMGASRTPVREALTRLQRDGFVEVRFRSGWQVRPFNFKYFEQLYDLRILLEQAAVRLVSEAKPQPDFGPLKGHWLVRPRDRDTDGPVVSLMDERFHGQVVEGTGNLEMVRVHQDVTERLRIVRRLDFTKPPRIEQTYEEHGKILNAILHRHVEQAVGLLTKHITSSKAEVQNITLHMLEEARSHR
jgi:DNA-binding GntR family transcriptional regulator